MNKKYLTGAMGLLMFHGFGMDKDQGSSPTQISSPRAKPSNVPTLACLAARCMGTKILDGDNINLITPSDLMCVKEVMLRELIKPHIYPLTITESENKESVHHNGVCGLDAITSTNEVVSGACDGKVVFCNKNSLAAGTAYVTNLSISALSVFEADEINIFLGCDRGIIYRMDYTTKQIDLKYRAHENTINRLCVGNSLIASCSNDKTVRIWEKQTGESRGVFNNFEQSVRGLEWLEGEKILVSGSSEGKIKVWNTLCLEFVKEFQYSERPRIWGLGTMKKKKYIVAGFNTGNLSVIDGRTLQEIAQWYGHGQTISALSCEEDEKYFATASWDGKARLWDERMRACAATFIGHTDWVQKVKCVGNQVVTGARDNMLRLWDIRKLKALDSIPLAAIASGAARLKNVPLLKKNSNERNKLLEELLTREP